MPVSGAPPVARLRDVQRFALERGLFFMSDERRFERFERGFDLELDFVCNAAEFGTLIFRKLAEILQF